MDAVGLASMAAGFIVLSFLGASSSYWHLAGGLVLFAAGMGLAGTPATTAITSSLPESRQGIASAVNDVSRELGAALGIAILGSLLNDRYRTHVQAATTQLPQRIAEHVKASIAFVEQAALHFGPAGARLAAQAEQAYVDGLRLALLAGAGILLWLKGAVTAGPDEGRRVRRSRRRRAPRSWMPQSPYASSPRMSSAVRRDAKRSPSSMTLRKRLALRRASATTFSSIVSCAISR